VGRRATSSTLVLLDHAFFTLIAAPNHDTLGVRVLCRSSHVLILLLGVVAVSKLVRVLNLLIEHLLDLLIVPFVDVFIFIAI